MPEQAYTKNLKEQQDHALRYFLDHPESLKGMFPEAEKRAVGRTEVQEMSDMAKLSISVCTYKSGEFDVILRDPSTSREVTLSGFQKVTGEDFEFLNEFAPACVFTTYKRVM